MVFQIKKSRLFWQNGCFDYPVNATFLTAASIKQSTQKFYSHVKIKLGWISFHIPPRFTAPTNQRVEVIYHFMIPLFMESCWQKIISSRQPYHCMDWILRFVNAAKIQFSNDSVGTLKLLVYLGKMQQSASYSGRVYTAASAKNL